MNHQSSFATAVEQVKRFALAAIQQEAKQKQLFYHTVDHAIAVQRRARRIFKVIAPHWDAAMASQSIPIDLVRAQLLLDLCAITHDMVQAFSATATTQGPRQREQGVSERATITKVCDYLQQLNQQWIQQGQTSAATFTATDLSIIQEAIEATICHYDPVDHSIFQPALYQQPPKFSLIAQILALADIGSLGMDGIDVFLDEGRLIFIEENLDLVPLIQQFMANQGTLDASAQETLRQRLLKRARFQLNFADSRFARFPQEIAGFPPEAITLLKTDVFKYLTPATLAMLADQTPTEDQTSLAQLIQFFQLEQFVAISPTSESSQIHH